MPAEQLCWVPPMTDRLWAPWRTAYVQSKREECCFCEALGRKDGPDNLVLTRAKGCLVILNLYPYNNGHLLVAPIAHKAALSDLDTEERLALLELVDFSLEALRESLHPHGFNVGMNLGRVAGAGVPGHLHIHIVPRWDGDTNFMPVLADTKVIAQSLDALYQLLRPLYLARYPG